MPETKAVENPPSVLREEVQRRYSLAFHQDDQESVPLVRDVDDPLSLRRLKVGKWSGLELVRRIAAAAGRTPGVDPAPPPLPEPDPAVDVPVVEQATTTTTAVPPPAAPPSTRPPSTTTPPRRQPATTAPAPAPATITSTTTTVAPPTITTTAPKGCRSHGGGNVCRPD